MNLDLNRGPRRRDFALEPTANGISQNELDDRFRAIQEESGILNINGQEFKNVKFEDLLFVADLGAGTCGNVTKRKYRARTMAVKEMKRTDNKEESKRIFMDLEIVKKSHNPHIVQCFGYIITMDHLYICMELMAKCFEKVLSDREYIGLPEVIIAKKIMHRDVKPSNILLDYHGNIKLCDFGISGQLIDSKATTMSTGCAAYLAPERIRREPYDVRADVWSLGVTLAQLARGYFPYANGPGQQNLQLFELMVKIRDEEPPSLDPTCFSQDFCEFVAKCLSKNVESRPKYRDLMQMPFLVRAKNSDVDVGHWAAHQDQYSPPYPPVAQ